MYDFITIGGTTRDISFFTDQGVIIKNHKDILRQKVLAFESGAKIKVDKFFYSYGGGAANAAVCLANFNFKTACLTSIGNDEGGRLIKKNLQTRRVDTRLVEKIKNEESGSSFVLIDPSGERILFVQRGANKSLSVNEKNVAYLKKTKNIYIASLAGNWPGNLRKIFSVVGSKGPNVFWNPGMTQLLNGADKLKRYFKKTTVLAVNKDEALALVVNSKVYKNANREELNRTENLIKIIHKFGAKIVVITMGKDGVMAFDGKNIYRRDILRETRCVDTTGVGDIFNSSFAAGWNLFKGDIDKALHLSLQNVAAKISHLGAQNGLIKI